MAQQPSLQPPRKRSRLSFDARMQRYGDNSIANQLNNGNPPKKKRKTKSPEKKLNDLRQRVVNELIYSKLSEMIFIDPQLNYWFCELCRKAGINACGLRVCNQCQTRYIVGHCSNIHHEKLLTLQLKQLNEQRKKIISQRREANAAIARNNQFAQSQSINNKRRASIPPPAPQPAPPPSPPPPLIPFEKIESDTISAQTHVQNDNIAIPIKIAEEKQNENEKVYVVMYHKMDLRGHGCNSSNSNSHSRAEQYADAAIIVTFDSIKQANKCAKSTFCKKINCRDTSESESDDGILIVSNDELDIELADIDNSGWDDRRRIHVWVVQQTILTKFDKQNTELEY